MAHLISFTTAKFDVSAEKPNPINPIAGRGVLLWLRDELSRAQYRVTEPDAEDWGWYMEAESSDGSYLVGASGDAEEPARHVEWVVQVHKNRSLKDKLFGRNKLAADDALFLLIEKIVRGDDAIDHVAVTRDA
jgi:hypothetical protein